MPEFCPTCGVIAEPGLRQRRTRYVVTPQGRAVLARMRGEEAMPKCKRCGAPALLGFVEGDKPIICGPCEQITAEEQVKA